MTLVAYTLGELAKRTGGQVQGDSQCIIQGLATLQDAGPGYMAFLANPLYRKFLPSTQASAVILLPEDAPLCPTNALIVSDPYVAYAHITHCFAHPVVIPEGIHPSVVLGEGVRLDPTCRIAANVVIADHVVIGPRTVIGAGCIIGENVEIGADTVLHPRVTLYPRVIIGECGVIQSGAVLGSEGFGFAYDKQQHTWVNIVHAGTVRVGNHVDIGANTTIDRGVLGDTLIDNYVKIDNQVQIAHNVHIGAYTVIAGCVGIAGSTHIGRYCQIGGAAAISGHITIADHVILTGMAMATSHILKAGIYSSGTGLMENNEWRKNAVRFRQLNTLARHVQELDKR